MQIFRIIQIGDIHYSDKANFVSPVDGKDSGFPSAVVESIGTPPLQAVFRSVCHLLDSENYDLVAFMGDFTTRGDREVLVNCINYIRGMFEKSWPQTGDISCKLIIGNHDIDRKFDPDKDERFNDVNSILTDAGFAPASVLVPSELLLSSASASSLQVYGINSCRGCGQLRLLGEIVEKYAGEAIKKLIESGGPEQEIDELYENIDTPAVDNQTLEAIQKSVARLSENFLPVICAHHNLLPQATPRIAPYSELINGGAVRNSLLSLNRPLLYMHGHLHTDPIEIIRVPSHPKSAIISVSAPQFRDGFNVIEIAFNSESVPLGLSIVTHRLEGSLVVPKESYVVQAWTTNEGLKIATPQSRDLMKILEPDVVKHRGDILKASGWTEAQLDDALNELRWLGIIEIKNYERPSLHWRIQRTI